MNEIYADRKFKMFVLMLLTVSICSGDPCPEDFSDESYRSFFFMRNIKDIQRSYSVAMAAEEICVCMNSSCYKQTGSEYQSHTIYRVNETKDIYVKYDSKSRHNAYRDRLLGTSYVVPVLHHISSEKVQHYLGIGNPIKTTVDVHIEYPRRNQFSVRSCRNESSQLRLGAFETIDIESNCQIAGIHINSSNKIIVYSASILEGYAMIEQLLPVKLWGNYYMVSPTSDLHDNKIVILTAYDNTTVHILGFDYVIIPKKYYSIQRRINGSDPVTIKSSRPVSVTQYIKHNDKWAMMNVIPMKYEINKNEIYSMRNTLFSFGSIKNDILDESKNKLPIFAKFHYYTDISTEKLSQPLYGCVTFKKSQPGQIVGTNCGFTEPSHSEPDWPIMEPGDGIDNDEDGYIDEEECFLSFSNLNGGVKRDCKNPFKSGFPDTFGSMFVLPMNETWTVKCTVEVLSGTPPEEVKIYFKSMFAGTIQWNLTTIQIVNNDFIIDPSIIDSNSPRELKSRLVIATIQSNNVSLICSCYKLNKTSSNSFIVPPVDILQTQYALVMPNISSNGVNNNIQCHVVTIFDNTSFALPMLNISKKNLPRLTISKVAWRIQKSSIFIVASHVISVICFQSFENAYLVNYVLPSSGTDYSICKNENQTKEIVMVSLDHSTVLNISEIDSDNFTEYVLLETGGSLQTYKMKNSSSLLSIIANKQILVLTWIETSSSPINHNIIYVPAVNLALNGSMTSTNLSGGDCFSLSDYDQPQPFRLYQRELPTVSEQIPGDGIDNDGDGLVDEEYCGFLWEDYNISDIDLDGAVNEDCKGCKEGEELSPLFVCKECDYGKFRENSSKIDSCQSCPDNQTTFYTKSNSLQACVPICEKGMGLVEGKCEPCQVGFYKNISVLDTSLNTTDRFECKRCPKNLTTYSTNSEDISDCIEHCEAGEYLSVNNCEPCKMGTYKNTSSKDISLNKMLRWNCSACERKWATISEGSKTCFKQCQKGYQFNRSSHQCEPCPLGFYKNETGIHFNCTQCPENYTTRATGKKSQNDCKKADCTCPCDRVHVQKNYTSSELSKLIEEMKKELIVNKDKLSSTTRKKISVMDSRPSSRSIGSFGIVIITFVFALLLAADVMILKNHISMLVRTLVDFGKGCARN